jgi:hypothetical protein
MSKLNACRFQIANVNAAAWWDFVFFLVVIFPAPTR